MCVTSILIYSFWSGIGGTLEDDDYYYGDQQQDGTTKSGSSSSSTKEDSVDADIIAYFLMMVGWVIICRSLADYFRAKQMEKIICSEPTAGETMV